MDYEEIHIEEEKESPIKKIIIMALAVFLILMFVSYIGISYGVGHIIGGLAESSLIEDNLVDYGNGRLIFSDNVLEGLDEVYSNNRGLEFKICLGGELLGNTYYLDEIIYPEMHSQKYNQVVAEPCPSDSLVDLHSHPEKRCIASQQDMRHFENLKERNANALMVIMCEQDRINIYS